jgi:hypothetical protein
MPMHFLVPDAIEPGEYRLDAKVVFSTGQTQEDAFTIHVLQRPMPVPDIGKVAVFDPQGETTRLLERVGVPCESVDAKADLTPYGMLIVGKAALTVDGPAPGIDRVRRGFKVIVFEQTPDVLEKRFGFRVAEYGLRNVIPRVPDHPILAGLRAAHLSDWRGEATILPPQLKYERHPKFNGAPTVDWCGIPVTRAWRCGNQGNVASVLIEKPACGDFLPVVDGGFSLQYSPLMEYREGNGMVLFCQLDVTGRTEADPAARALVANLLAYVTRWQPPPQREAIYAGAQAGRDHFEVAGFPLRLYRGGALPADSILILGQDGRSLSPHREAVCAFLETGGRLLAIGLAQEDVDAILPFGVSMRQAEHISAFFEPAPLNSPLTGIGPADVHNRAPRVLPLASGGAQAVGNGVLAVAPRAGVVLCQLVPWQFEYRGNFGLKRTYRRTSFLVTRLLSNLGVHGQTPLLARFSAPVEESEPARWLDGFYLDAPQEWDDPYRFFRW